MATITALPTDAPRPGSSARQRVRAAAARAVRQAAQAVSTVRHLDRSPVLTVSGFGFIDLAAWETFGRGAGWLALGISILAFDWAHD